MGSRACNSFRSCFAWQCWCKTVHPSYAQQPLPLGHRQYHCREIDCARRCCFIAAQGIYSRATHSSAHVFLFDLPVSAALRSGSSNLASLQTVSHYQRLFGSVWPLQTFVASLMERPAAEWQAVQQPACHELQVGTLVSRGSKNHHKGQCNPCRNHFTAAGCRDGQMCNFCHMPHSKEWLERAAALRELRRAERPQRPRANPAREQRTKVQPRYHPEVRSWEGGELHTEHSSVTQARGEMRSEPGRQQLLVPEVPDRLSKFESTKGKGKRSKGSKGSQGKGYSAGRASAAERWLEDEASSSSITVHGEVMRL